MTSYKRLFIWVEGDDDERFFRNILKPKLHEKYDSVEIIKYATMKKEKVYNFVKSIQAMGADYIYVTDINDFPCITAKKEEVQKRVKNIDSSKIIVVIKEIESWYLAGLDAQACKEFNIHNVPETDSITKEQFDALIPEKFISRIDFMLEILKVFSIESAKQKNMSFKYFIMKYDCET